MPAVTKPNARPGLRRRRSWRRGTRVRAPERRSRQNCAFARRQNPDGYASGISRHATIASCPSPRALIEPNEGSRFHDHEIARRAISRIEARGKGILLLHDIRRRSPSWWRSWSHSVPTRWRTAMSVTADCSSRCVCPAAPALPPATCCRWWRGPKTCISSTPALVGGYDLDSCLSHLRRAPS
jgi:hypothetical protein